MTGALTGVLGQFFSSSQERHVLMAQAEISPLTRQPASTFFVLQTKLLRNMFPGVTKNKLQFTWSLRHLYGKVPSVSN